MPIFLAVSLYRKDKDTFLTVHRRGLHVILETLRYAHIAGPLQWLAHCGFIVISVEI